MQSRDLIVPVKSATAATIRKGTRKMSAFGGGPKRDNSRDESERFAAIIPALKTLTVTQSLKEHKGLVRHLEFSPDGKYLATCSWDRTALIWKISDSFLVHRTLLHPGTGLIEQVAWSPSGSHLLTKMYSAVKLWSAESGLLIKTVHRKHKIEAVKWSPGGGTFACLQRDHIHVIDLQGQDVDLHRFKRMEILDAAFTPNERRILVVATLFKTTGGLMPSEPRAEKRVIVYDLRDKEIETQVPVSDNVRNVTISRDGHNCLLSSENFAPPEVWRIHLVRKRGSKESQGRLERVCTYLPETAVNVVSPSYFGGLDDQFIVSVGKQGEIQIWDRETGLFLNSLQGASMVDGIPEDLTGIAWNPNTPGQFMFASATQDGIVRIWTADTAPAPQPSARAGTLAPMSRSHSQDLESMGAGLSSSLLSKSLS